MKPVTTWKKTWPYKRPFISETCITFYHQSLAENHKRNTAKDTGVREEKPITYESQTTKKKKKTSNWALIREQQFSRSKLQHRFQPRLQSHRWWLVIGPGRQNTRWWFCVRALTDWIRTFYKFTEFRQKVAVDSNQNATDSNCLWGRP